MTSAPAAYFLLSVLTASPGAHGTVTTSVETLDRLYPTMRECKATARDLAAIAKQRGDHETYRCDPGGPDIPTQMELAAGE